jgi:hypothetical protein
MAIDDAASTGYLRTVPAVGIIIDPTWPPGGRTVTLFISKVLVSNPSPAEGIPLGAHLPKWLGFSLF